MNCNVIQDLLPLFVDRCCSEESAQLVKSHTAQCAACKKTLEAMEQSEPELFSEPSGFSSEGLQAVNVAMHIRAIKSIAISFLKFIF